MQITCIEYNQYSAEATHTSSSRDCCMSVKWPTWVSMPRRTSRLHLVSDSSHELLLPCVTQLLCILTSRESCSTPMTAPHRLDCPRLATYCSFARRSYRLVTCPLESRGPRGRSWELHQWRTSPKLIQSARERMQFETSWSRSSRASNSCKISSGVPRPIVESVETASRMTRKRLYRARSSQWTVVQAVERGHSALAGNRLLGPGRIPALTSREIA